MLFLMEACIDNISDKNNSKEVSSLNGNEFIMVVDRIAESPDVQLPSDRLEEKDYSPYSGEKKYNAVFSADGRKVSLSPGPIGGVKKETGDGVVEYELNDSLFAGGRFVVWINNDKFEAELTIYGSGVPITFERTG